MQGLFYAEIYCVGLCLVHGVVGPAVGGGGIGGDGRIGNFQRTIGHQCRHPMRYRLGVSAHPRRGRPCRPGCRWWNRTAARSLRRLIQSPRSVAFSPISW